MCYPAPHGHTVDEWLDGACSQNCAPETIDTAATDYESGCAEDLAASNSVAVRARSSSCGDHEADSAFLHEQLALDTVIRNFTIVRTPYTAPVQPC